MSTAPTRNFALTPELDRYIRDKVASGRYASASEVIRAGLRLLEESDQRKARRSKQDGSSGLRQGRA